MDMYVIGIDVESCGPFGPVLAVGLVLARIVHNNADAPRSECVVMKLATLRVVVRVKWPDADTQYGDFDPITWDTFWARQSVELHQLLQTGAVSADEAADAIAEFIRAANRRVPPSTVIDYVTDCPHFDVGQINAMLGPTRGVCLPYGTETRSYADVWDLSNNGMLAPYTPGEVASVRETIPFIGFSHTHDPLDDAISHVMMFAVIKSVVYPFPTGSRWLVDVIAPRNPDFPNAKSRGGWVYKYDPSKPEGEDLITTVHVRLAE